MNAGREAFIQEMSRSVCMDLEQVPMGVLRAVVFDVWSRSNAISASNAFLFSYVVLPSLPLSIYELRGREVEVTAWSQVSLHR